MDFLGTLKVNDVYIVFHDKHVSVIDSLQCLHFSEYSMHVYITGRQKQTNKQQS